MASSYANYAALGTLVPADLRANLKYLPKVEDQELNRIFNDQETYWYNNDTLPHAYQDSVTTVLGVRYNRVGLQSSTIANGERIFDENGFKFPFAHAVGTDKSKDLYIINFFSLPTVNGQRLNIPWWIDDTTRWRWLYPIGTLFGEVVFVKAPAGMPQPYYPVEIRTRRRHQEGWEPDVFRPFGTWEELDAAVVKARPNWNSTPQLTQVINHLRTPNNLVATTLGPDQWYAKAIEPIKGSLDVLPDFGDNGLVAQLLTENTFRSVEGKVWKSATNAETYAPSTDSTFSIVPYKYEGGLFPVHEISCNRCHEDTGRQIGEFSNYTQLYGEIWGEDRIFTWHLFDENKDRSNARLDATFDENRYISRIFEGAGVVEKRDKTKHKDEYYKELKRRFKIQFR